MVRLYAESTVAPDHGCVQPATTIASPIDALRLDEHRGGHRIATAVQATIAKQARAITAPRDFPDASQSGFSGKRACSLFDLSD